MRVLIDNCAEFRFKRWLPNHDVTHARDLRFESLSNGKLIAAAHAAGFQALVTTDKSLEFEQNLTQLPLIVAVLQVSANTLTQQRSHLTSLVQFLETPAAPGLYRIFSDGRHDRAR